MPPGGRIKLALLGERIGKDSRVGAAALALITVWVALECLWYVGFLENFLATRDDAFF